MGSERTTQRQRPDAPVDEREAPRPVATAPAYRAAPVIQPKLVVGAADDPLEREADEIARRVVDSLAASPADRPLDGRRGPATSRATPSSSASWASSAPAARAVRRRSDVGAPGGPLDDETARRIQQASGTGSPLPSPVRRTMESAFGADFSTVRVHHGAEARDLNDRVQASAFTLGHDVFFRDGAPDTSTAAGTELLAHELTHTLQQSGRDSVARVQRKRGGSKRRRSKAPKRAGRGPRNATGRGTEPPTRAPATVAPTAASAFTDLARLVDVAVPAPGDAGAVEASVKVPLDPVSFLQFDLSGEVERDREGVELGLDVAVGYGGGVGDDLPFGLSAELVGKLGGFLEAKAANSAQALTLISYGFYRQFRESSVMPREVADRLWGQGGATGTSAGDESEQWAAAVENQIFAGNDAAQVSLGAYAALEGGLERDDDELGVGMKLSTATTYSKASLEQSASDGGSQLGKAGKERDSGWIAWLAGGVGRGAQKSVGEVERKLELSAEASVGPFEGEATFEVALQRDLEYTFEMSGAGDLRASERRPAQIAEHIAAWVASARRIHDFIRANERTLEQHAGVLGDAADTIGGVFDAYSSRRDELARLLHGQIGGKGTRAVKVGITVEHKGGATTNELTVSYVTAHEVEGDLGIELSASVERERTLFTLEWP